MAKKNYELHPDNRNVTVEIEAKNTASRAKLTGRLYRTKDGLKIVVHNTQGAKALKDAAGRIHSLCVMENEEG